MKKPARIGMLSMILVAAAAGTALATARSADIQGKTLPLGIGNVMVYPPDLSPHASIARADLVQERP